MEVEKNEVKDFTNKNCGTNIVTVRNNHNYLKLTAAIVEKPVSATQTVKTSIQYIAISYISDPATISINA